MRYLFLLLFVANLPAAPRLPNVVLLLADDLGYGELGCQGNPEIPTPHIDSLAQDGVRFTQAYVTASYCSPSRAGLLTGRYQTRFGHEMNPVGQDNLDPSSGLPLSEATLADLLQGAGYATALIGKWHLGGTPERHPLRRGFDRFFGFLHEGHFYVPHPASGVTSFLRTNALPDGGKGQWRQGDTIWSTHLPYSEPPYDDHNPILDGTNAVTEQAYVTDAITREALAFLKQPRQQPFFLYVAYSAVHSPMQGAAAYMDTFGHIQDIQRRVFAAMLANMDDSVGAILGALRDAGLENDTLVFFLSDNGGPTRELTSSNHPLRGGKGDLYEGGIRIPFLFQWKGRLRGGATYDQPVLSTDIFATATAVAGVERPVDRAWDGVNLMPYLTGATKGPPHEVLYWRMGHRTALRKGPWKIVRNDRDESTRPFELYRLDQDIGETRNLAGQAADRLEELMSAWNDLNGQMIGPIWRRSR